MEDTVWQRVQEHYKSDGCSTQNEFIAKAILFYLSLIHILSSMLGHFDAGFTLRTYTHVTRQMQESAAEKMGNFMAQVM